MHLCLVNLFTSILNIGYIPNNWKTGILIPIYKGGSKSTVDPDSYRAVSLLPSFYKLLERIICNKLNEFMTDNKYEFPCQQQQGFQKQLGSLTVSFNLHETLYHTVERNGKAYAALLDIRKAFDTVSHSGLISKLMQLKIPPIFVNIIKESYTDIFSSVRVNGYSSRPFKLKQGVRQGGVLSSFLYLVYINDLLKELEESELGACICDLKTGNPTLADDITLIAMSPLSLQMMLNIVSQYALNWKFQVSKTKSFAMNIDRHRRKPVCDFQWTLDSDPIPIVDSTVHVGIQLASNINTACRIEEACRKGRKAFLCGYLVSVYQTDYTYS